MCVQGDGSAVMAVEDVAREKMASYKDYIDLWSYLMDPSEIKVSNERFAVFIYCWSMGYIPALGHVPA